MINIFVDRAIHENKIPFTKSAHRRLRVQHVQIALSTLIFVVQANYETFLTTKHGNTMILPSRTVLLGPDAKFIVHETWDSYETQVEIPHRGVIVVLFLGQQPTLTSPCQRGNNSTSVQLSRRL